MYSTVDILFIASILHHLEVKHVISQSPVLPHAAG